jgi:hypothetical protein
MQPIDSKQKNEKCIATKTLKTLNDNLTFVYIPKSIYCGSS